MAQLKEKIKDFPKIHKVSEKKIHLLHNRPFTHFKKIHIPKKVHTFEAFKIVDYRYLWTAHAIFSSAFWLQQVVIGWLTYQITQSPFLTSVIMGLDALPLLIGAPLGGLITDKFDKRKLLGVIYTYQATIIVIFGIIVINGYAATWNIFGFVSLMGLAWTMYDPAKFSLMAMMVPKEGLVNAFALNSMAFSMMRLFIPALGGLLITLIGTGPILFIQAGIMISAGIITQFIKITNPDQKSQPSFKKIVPEIKSGFNFVIENPIIIGFMCTTSMMLTLVIPFMNGLMPVYAAEIFNVGPKGLGFLLSAAGLGSFLSTILLASIKNVSRPGVIGGLVMAFLSIAMFSMAINNIYIVSLVIVMLISGATMNYFNIAGATVQGLIPDSLRGRVTGIYMMAWGFIPFGGLLAGTLASIFSVQIATFIGGLILFFCVCVSFFSFKKMWAYNPKADFNKIL